MDDALTCYKGLKVLVTGHTGFKGSWLAIWLRELGAEVIGYSLPPPTTPSLFHLAHVGEKIEHVEGDLLDRKLQETICHYRPDMVFHLAAQAIVLKGYETPVDTFRVNAMGTVHLLEAVRACPSVKATVVVTTDKCYENRNWCWGYREEDVLGGHDPYSASKAMAELSVASYRASFGQNVATARAGNVIGGGDFSDFRILPDAMRALFVDKPIHVRNPASVRPWMHVLDPLNGYLTLGAHLLKNRSFAQSYNFGPKEPRGIAVRELVEKVLECWGRGAWIDVAQNDAPPEKNTLRLNWDKAAHDLFWTPHYSWEQAVEATVDWYRGFKEAKDLYALTVQQIEQHQGVSYAV